MPELKAAIVPVTPFQQNCTILWQEPSKRGVVIDPGGEVPRILEAIGKLEVRIERILLTHGHIDHAGGAAALKEALEQAAAPRGAHGSAEHQEAEASPATVPIEGPDQRDRFLLQGLEAQAPMFGMSGVRNVLPDRWLAEGDEVRIGDHVVRGPALPRPHPRSRRVRQPAGAFCHRRRCAVRRLGRAHRLSLRRPRRPDRRDQGQAAAARRRLFLHLRPRSRLDHRRRAPQQPVSCAVEALAQNMAPERRAARLRRKDSPPSAHRRGGRVRVRADVHPGARPGFLTGEWSRPP